jgi:hypothetical protein
MTQLDTNVLTAYVKCNRIACDAEGVFKHAQIGKLYCARCARRINECNVGLIPWTTDPVTVVINQLLQLIPTHNPTTINGGLCEDFAEMVKARLDAYDRPHLKQHKIEVLWDHQADERFTNNSTQWTWAHCFVHRNGKFYDAECPEGVDNWLDLPFFKRNTPDCNKLG